MKLNGGRLNSENYFHSFWGKSHICLSMNIFKQVPGIWGAVMSSTPSLVFGCLQNSSWNLRRSGDFETTLNGIWHLFSCLCHHQKVQSYFHMLNIKKAFEREIQAVILVRAILFYPYWKNLEYLNYYWISLELKVTYISCLVEDLSVYFHA